MPDPYAASADPSGDPLGTSSGTNLSALDLLGMLSGIYGSNPFEARHTGVGGEERAYSYGDLAFLTQQGLTQQDALDFVQNVATALSRQGVTLAQAGPATLTQLIQQAWADPNIRQEFLIKLSTGTATGAVTSMASNILTGGGSSALSTPVPTPFEQSYFGNITQAFGVAGENGTDFGMPQGQRIYTPFAGYITTVDEGKANWGKKVSIHLDNGYTIEIGHLHSFNVTDGTRVNPGDLLGLSGGNINDPSSGHSSGDHIEFMVKDAQGHFVNPMPYLTQIYGGATFQQMMGTFGVGIYGAGLDPTQQKNRLLGVDPILEAKYGSVESLWQKYFGTLPTAEQMLRIIGQGSDVTQWEEAIRRMDSHLGGVSIGTYTDLKSLADGAMQKVYGMPANDTIIKELFDKGLGDPSGVNYYVDQLPFQPGKHVDPIVFNTVYGSANQFTQSIWNQGPHPLDLESIWKAAGSPGAIPASQVALETLKQPPLHVVGGDLHGG